MESEQVQAVGYEIEDGDDHQTQQHLDGTGSANQENDSINYIRDDEDVNGILPSYGINNVKH